MDAQRLNDILQKICFQNIKWNFVKIIDCLLVLLLLFWIKILSAQVVVAADGMNVVYLGLTNPISIAISDVPDSCLNVLASHGNIHRTGKGRFEWNIIEPDTNVAKLTIFDTRSCEQIAEYAFRVKKMPEPVALLGARHRSKTMDIAEFKAQAGIANVIECCDFDAKAETIGFETVLFDHETRTTWIGRNAGARWTGETSAHLQKVRPGDWVVFRKIDYRQPGDKVPQRSSQELFFQLK